MATLEERVEALEALTAQMAGSGDYTLGLAGETIDAILAGISDAAVYHGTTEIVVRAAASTAGANIDLGFAPTENTKIIGSVRRKDSYAYYTGVELTFHYIIGPQNHIYANLTFGGNYSNMGQSPVPGVIAGTYYIDWICIDRGEASA